MRVGQVLATMGEACRLLGHLMAPFTPGSAREIHAQLGVTVGYDERGAGGPGLARLLAWDGEPGPRRTRAPQPIFPRVDLPDEVPAP